MRVGIALGRGVALDGTSNPATDANAHKAADLLLAGLIHAVILSGNCSFRMKAKPKRTEARNMLKILHGRGVRLQPPYVQLDEKSSDTVGNFLFSEELLANLENVTELVIICLPWTGFRAKYIARKLLGHNYRLRVIHSSYQYTWRERLRIMYQEVRNYIFMRLIWLGISHCDRENLLRQLYRWHPAFKQHQTAKNNE